MDAARRKRDSKRSKSFNTLRINKVTGISKTKLSKQEVSPMLTLKKGIEKEDCDLESIDVSYIVPKITKKVKELEMDVEITPQGHRSRNESSESAFNFADDLFDVPTFPENDSDNSSTASIQVISHLKTFEVGVSYRKFDCNTILISILEGCKLHFSGKCKIRVLKGVIDICGFECSRYDSETERTVFSPKGYSLLSIQGVEENDNLQQLHISPPVPSLATISQKELKDIPGAVFLMEGFENSWCEGIRKYCLDGNALVGREMTGIGPGKVPKLKFFRKKLGFEFQPSNKVGKKRLFHKSPYWDSIVNVLSKDDSRQFNGVKLAVFGGKGVGKSTLSRWLTNKFLRSSSSVLYIDLDPGQAEFTPPGLISVIKCNNPLLGPNFTHLEQPLLSIFLRSLNVTDCPQTYVLALRQIRDFVIGNTDLDGIPWIINTMGFTQGLGIDFACEMINLFEPTDVIQIKVESPRRSFAFDLEYDAVLKYKGCFVKTQTEIELRKNTELPGYRFFSVKSVCDNENGECQENQWGISTIDLRNNVLVSYFAEQIGLTEDTNLLSVIPFNIPLSVIAIGTASNQQQLLYEGILKVINGNLVALCKCPPEYIKTTEVSPTKTQLLIANTTDSVFLYHCIGFGFVRAIDTKLGILHVITPCTDILKSNLNAVIAAGTIGVPLQFYLNSSKTSISDHSSAVNIPYVMNTRQSHSKLHQATRKNFVPKKATHNVLKSCLI